MAVCNARCERVTLVIACTFMTTGVGADLPVLSPDLLGRGVEAHAQLLEGVQPEGAEDAVHLVVAVDALHVVVELLRGGAQRSVGREAMQDARGRVELSLEGAGGGGRLIRANALTLINFSSMASAATGGGGLSSAVPVAAAVLPFGAGTAAVLASGTSSAEPLPSATGTSIPRATRGCAEPILVCSLLQFSSPAREVDRCWLRRCVATN